MVTKDSRSNVDQIKDRLGIEEVVSSYMKLEKAGKNLKGRCPFHNEKTPSFYVTPDRGTFYCFGCGQKGDIFSFVQQFEGLDFMGSLKLLADRAGVELHFDGGKSGNNALTKSEKERLLEAMEAGTLFYEKNLAGDSKDSIEAREYIKKRGITPETVKLFRIGYAPNDWRLLLSHMKSSDAKGGPFKEVELEKAGLIKKTDKKVGDEAYYDTFRDRIVFPISDSSGRVIAFSGRILHDDGATAKYLNSPDTVLFNKSTVLYGIDKAKQAIRERGYTIMVEGQMDLVLSHQAGIKNTVAVSGTALSDRTTIDSSATSIDPSRGEVVNNLGIVRRLSSNVILAFDSDTAGRKATMRSAQIALSLGMDVKIASMPLGKDPADMVLEDPESWKNVLRGAKPVVEFQLDAVMVEAEEKKLDSRKLPALIREKVLPFILSHEGSMEQAHFVKMIHERTGLDQGAIKADLREVGKKIEDAKRASAVTIQTRQTPVNNGILSPVATTSRLDMISRKLFGLAAFLSHTDKATASLSIFTSMKGIAGDVRYHNLISAIEPLKDELILEAEIFIGQDVSPEKIQKNIDELLLNFEEDILKQDFTSAMSRLGILERKKGSADSKTVEEEANDLMKRCQEYAKRLSEIVKDRK